MRSLSILLLPAFFVVLIQSRPSQTDENNESDLEEAAYLEEDKAVVYDPHNEDSSLNEDSGRGIDQTGRVLNMNKHTYSFEQKHFADSRSDGSHSDISDYKPYGDQDERNDKTEETNNYDDQNYAKRPQSKDTENKDAETPQEAAQHLNNPNVNYYRNSRITTNVPLEDPPNKREVSAKATSNEQGEMLFGSQDQETQEDHKDLNNEPLVSNQRYSKYYTQMHTENKELKRRKSREGDHHLFNRDRRESINSNEDTAVSKIEADKDLNKNQNEDEEMAIRRHIKKLSSEELEELLSSLSEEKRELLKRIIDETDLTDSIDSVIKREITKKAGALEENTCIQSGQADSNIHEENSAAASVSTEVPAQITAATELNKQPQSENSLLLNAQSTKTNSSIKARIMNQQDDGVHLKADVDASDAGAEKTPAQIVPSKQLATKNEKRETNLDDLADIVSFEDPKAMGNDWLTGDSKDQQGYLCSQDEDLSQFFDDEQAVANDDSKVYKRDLERQTDYEAKYKLLEESFPKSTNYDESDGPLIRVKRKNEPVIKKRSAAMVPVAKVAFFPYNAENDEDNEEGNEFDDDGFYDRTPNFSSNEVNEATISKLNDKDRQSSIEVSKGTLSLGTDTDNVLSGVEGVDETLMFSSGSRNRRTSEEISDVMDESNSIHNSKSLSDESKAVSDMNALTFQDSDSFGPLPKNNDGESGRYKRIRRVKQSRPESVSSES